jgi:membrane associated rhomboid family serine protease
VMGALGVLGASFRLAAALRLAGPSRRLPLSPPPASHPHLPIPFPTPLAPQVVVAYAVNRTGRHSLLVVVLAALFVIATAAAAAAAAMGVAAVVRDPRQIDAVRPACARARD